MVAFLKCRTKCLQNVINTLVYFVFLLIFCVVFLCLYWTGHCNQKWKKLVPPIDLAIAQIDLNMSLNPHLLSEIIYPKNKRVKYFLRAEFHSIGSAK